MEQEQNFYWFSFPLSIDCRYRVKMEPSPCQWNQFGRKIGPEFVLPTHFRSTIPSFNLCSARDALQ